jgi:cytoskeleton protein RodZ
LRKVRLDRGLSLEAVAARTKINQHLLEDLERNDLTRWPAVRFYQESYLRSYAAAVGLNPQHVIERFRSEYPAPDAAAVAPHEPQRSASPWLVFTAVGVGAVIVTVALVSRDPVARAPQSQSAETVQAEGVRSTSGEAAYAAPSEAAPTAQAVDQVAPVAPTPAAVQPPPAAQTPSVARTPAPETPLPDASPSAAARPVEDSVPVVRDTDGELMIDSTPSGARVTVNGIFRGNTPVRVQFLPPGTYTIRIIGTGVPIEERRVTLTPAKPSANLSVVLE